MILYVGFISYLFTQTDTHLYATDLIGRWGNDFRSNKLTANAMICNKVSFALKYGNRYYEETKSSAV